LSTTPTSREHRDRRCRGALSRTRQPEAKHASDATFSSYDDVALASDILALIDELREPAFLVGISMAAGAAVIAAAEAPTQVTGTALLGPFVRDPQGGAMAKLLFRILLTKPWGPAAFLSYYPQWLPGTKPADYRQHKAQVRENLRRPGHWPAFVQTTRTTHAPAERRLSDVHVPAVVVMGAADVDWKDPAAEAAWIGEQLHARVVMVPPSWPSVSAWRSPASTNMWTDSTASTVC
jgi:pimeloyl-ACP methyl ester carboxylesterase